jgi:probable F420-dependent oxidoreductase
MGSWEWLVKFVTSMAFSDPAHLCELARAADRSGFDYVALSDHVVHPRELRTPYPYTEDGTPRWEPFTSWPDPWVAISAMAAVTERLKFYTSVYVLPMRDPFTVAKTVGTAAVLSRDRVALGVGAGWMRDEFELLEKDFGTRGRRMNEMIGVLRKLWGGGWVDHHGEFFDFDALEMSPVPARPIPIFVGGFSKPALRRAATLGDGWISDLHDTGEISRLIGELRAYRADSEQADSPMTILGSVNDAFDLDGYRRLEDAGVTHVVTMPWLFYGASQDVLQEKIDGMERFAEDVLTRLG